MCLVRITIMKIVMMQLSWPSSFVHRSIGKCNKRNNYNWEWVQATRCIINLIFYKGKSASR